MANQTPSNLGKGVDPKSLLGGLGLLAIGIGAAIATLMTGYTLTIMRIPLPPIVVAAVGGVVALAGMGMCLFSLRQHKCARCNASLDPSMAFFPVDATELVRQACGSLNAGLLATLPVGSPAERHVQISLEACPRCHAVGMLTLAAFNPSRVELIGATEVGGPALPAFVAVVRQREEQHEARYEAS